MKYLNWAQLVLGLWIFVSPWILGFSDISTALWSNVITGALIVIFALWELFGHKSSTPQATQ
jgi:Flp pilus assembly protein protease CpaA